MQAVHVVQVAAFGQIGRFVPVDSMLYARNQRVICRTGRGLEVGRVLNRLDESCEMPDDESVDGTILRRVTTADDLLLSRLERDRDAAFQACADRIAERNLSAVLMDVELTFDGQSIFFYFLGDVPNGVEAITEELAALYESTARIEDFANTLTAGCGPDCGSESASGGCEDGGCATCSIAKACQSD